MLLTAFKIYCKMEYEDIKNLQTYCRRCQKKTKFEDQKTLKKNNEKLLVTGYCSKCMIKKSCVIKYETNWELE